MLKKSCVFLFAALLTCALMAVAFAADAAKVGAVRVETKPGQPIVIPVTISGNPGLMGFKLRFDYPAGVLKSPAAQRGAVTSAGMFNDSITGETNGSFTVVWTNAQNVTADGPLCVLDFTVSSSAAPGEYIIKITASQPDTFNEKWEDVALDCKDISVTVAEATTAAETTAAPGATAPGQTTAKPAATSAATVLPTTAAGSGEFMPAGIDSGYLVSAVDGALARLGSASIDHLPQAQYGAFVELVAAKLNAYGAGEVTLPPGGLGEAVQAIRTAYLAAKADNYVATVLESVDGDIITQTVEEALNALGAKSIEDLSGKQKQAFARDVTAKLRAYHAGEKADLEGLSDEQAFEAVNDLYKQAKNEQTPPAKPDSPAPVIIGISAGTVLLAGGAALFIYKKRGRNISDRREKDT